ncbi:MAG: CDP-alcohol phosphatidyltransferase family protein [Promethearchaeati archaeon SRVP18_Atabeyarchaeia-1]
MTENRLRLRTVFRPVIDPVASLFTRLRLTPNMVTAFGALLATTTPFLMANSEYLLFGIMVFLVGFLDGVDGAIARMTGTSTKWGGFLDSMLDRYGDSLILLSYLFIPVAAPLGETKVLAIQFRMWICVAIIGSLMVSYTRAKSEAIGVRQADVGIAARSERLLLLSVTGILGCINEYIAVYGLVAVAALANFTALYRIAHTNAILRREEENLKQCGKDVHPKRGNRQRHS